MNSDDPIFVSEDELTDTAILAGLIDGHLERWRTDGEGKRWFKATERHVAPATIRGIPDASTDIYTP